MSEPASTASGLFCCPRTRLATPPGEATANAAPRSRLAPSHLRRTIMSIGIVSPQVMHFAEPLPLQSGAALADYSLTYETYGTLNADKSNVTD